MLSEPKNAQMQMAPSNVQLRIDPWQISCDTPLDDFCQSVFCLGNGALGVRGFGAWQQRENPQEHALFKAGLFEEIKPGITDMVQLPDVLTLAPVSEKPETVNQLLDMQTGILTHRWKGERADIEMERAVSMADKQLIMQRLTLTAKETGTYTVRLAADGKVRNLPVHDDQMAQALELVQLLEIDEMTPEHLVMHTTPSGKQVTFAWTWHSDREAEARASVTESTAQTLLTVQLKAGESWTVEKYIRVRVGNEELCQVVRQANATVAAPAASSAQTHYNPWQAHRAAWEALWRDCDMEIDGDPELQGAIRYNIFQLLCNNAADDPNVSIGARGLTHGRYKGNTFWDTEIFLLSFYLWTRPEAARNLLQYRADRLEDAKALAKKQNLEGARYPWMCSESGLEQCESWDIGLCEVHVTADVAYAMDRYVQVTGDKDFAKEQAAPVWRETAKYWQSRLTWEPGKEQYSSFFVKGPDEYCGATVNNTFTNYMARHNIRLALAHGELPPQEKAELSHVAEHVAILYDPARKLYLQDELLERLEEAPFLKQGDIPSYKQVCFDRVQRFKVLKQADLVLLMTLFPMDFSEEEKRNVFAYYEPITLHDSTLSYGAHAQLALQLGLEEKAWAYLKKAAFLDLKDVMGNTAQEGIHMAALGSTWQALAFGAAGLWEEGGQLRLTPHLPQGIRGLKFHVYFQGKRYAVEVTHTTQCIKEEV